MNRVKTLCASLDRTLIGYVAAFALMIVVAFAAGCAGNGVNGVSKSGAMEMAFVVGVMKSIEKADDQNAKATRIRNHVQQFQAALNGDSVRGAILEQLIQELIGTQNLAPSDQYLLSRLSVLSAGFIGEDQFIVGANLERLRDFLGQIEAVTYLYE